MHVFGIDPGPERSAWAQLNAKTTDIVAKGLDDNELLRMQLRQLDPEDNFVAIEVVRPFRGPGGGASRSLYDTQFEAGRFVECFSGPHLTLARKTIVTHIASSPRANDTQVRAALREVWYQARPEQLEGAKRDIWSAIAVSLTAIDYAPVTFFARGLTK